MRNLYPLLFVSLMVFGTSCSKKTAVVTRGDPHEEKERSELADSKTQPEATGSEFSGDEDREVAPDSDQIGEDCVAFLRATRAVSPQKGSGVCPQCPAGDNNPEVFQFQSFKIGKIAAADGSCQVDVVIQARFNPSAGGTISGGLVGWISQGDRKDYAAGKTPTGLRTYRVGVVYRREDSVWQPIEFEQAR
jgi:hypothetical protein